MAPNSCQAFENQGEERDQGNEEISDLDKWNAGGTINVNVILLIVK